MSSFPFSPHTFGWSFRCLSPHSSNCANVFPQLEMCRKSPARNRCESLLTCWCHPTSEPTGLDQDFAEDLARRRADRELGVEAIRELLSVLPAVLHRDVDGGVQVILLLVVPFLLNLSEVDLRHGVALAEAAVDKLKPVSVLGPAPRNGPVARCDGQRPPLQRHRGREDGRRWQRRRVCAGVLVELPLVEHGPGLASVRTAATDVDADGLVRLVVAAAVAHVEAFAGVVRATLDPFLRRDPSSGTSTNAVERSPSSTWVVAPARGRRCDRDRRHAAPWSPRDAAARGLQRRCRPGGELIRGGRRGNRRR